ncbi:MAG: MBL fold metallo-hydrolase [Gammaproteobacteria bacterium]
MQQRRFLPMLTTLLLAAAGSGSLMAAGGPLDFTLQKVTDDIYVAVRPIVNRIPVEGNVTFIINEQDVVVVDAGGFPQSARNLIALLETLTDKPVSTLINTHWHGDHNLGNQVWLQKYPVLDLVAHENTKLAMTGPAMDYVEEEVKQMDGYKEVLQQRIETGKFRDGRDIDAESLQRYKTMLNDLPALVNAASEIVITPPTRTFKDSLILQRGERKIKVFFLGRGNTNGDAIVYVPDQETVITGDLVVLPIPYGLNSFPEDWILTLQQLRDMKWKFLIPGHGAVQTDDFYLADLQDLLKEVRKQVYKGVAHGFELEKIRENLNLDEYAEKFSRGSSRNRMLFEAYWKQPISESAYKEARGEPIIQSGAD